MGSRKGSQASCGRMELPSVIIKVTSSGTALWTTTPRPPYPFSLILRLRVLQIVCGLSVMIMGSVACIDQRGSISDLALGIPAGILTVVAAGGSIQTSRGFGGWVPDGWEPLDSKWGPLKALGPTPLVASCLGILWIAASTLHLTLLVFSILTIKKMDRVGETRFAVGVAEMILCVITLCALVLIMRVDCVQSPEYTEPPAQGASSSSERQQTENRPSIFVPLQS